MEAYVSGPGRVSLSYLPGGLRKTADPSHETRSGALFSTFFVFFSASKNVEKTDGQKIDFFSVNLSDFWASNVDL